MYDVYTRTNNTHIGVWHDLHLVTVSDLLRSFGHFGTGTELSRPR